MKNIILVGYGQMLYSLVDGIEKTDNKIVGVLRNDRRKYSKFQLFFKDIFNPSQDYTIIKSRKLKEIKTQSVNSKEFIKEIKKLNADIVIVGSWGEKFKKEILNFIPCINFHPALLPKNRGANPYFWSIYLNQKTTGLTIHFMNEKFDQGDIILQEAINIDENETGQSLKNKTTILAKEMVRDFLNLYNQNKIQTFKQDETKATYQNQISDREVIIDLNKTKTELDRHLRALYPWASPYVKIKNRYIKFKYYEFLNLSKENIDKKPFEIIENNINFFILKGFDFEFKIYKTCY